jgi:hypothetical protein
MKNLGLIFSAMAITGIMAGYTVYRVLTHGDPIYIAVNFGIVVFSSLFSLVMSIDSIKKNS